MKIFTTEGIIFRNVKYGESSLILDIFTLEKGLSSFIVSGVRNSRSRTKANLYRPSQIIEISAYLAENNKLSRIKESNYKYQYQNVFNDVVKSSVITFLTEIARNSIVERESNPELYAFLTTWFLYLDNIQFLHPCLHHRFMIELSVFLGFEPMNNYDEKNLYFDLASGEFNSLQSLRSGLTMEESLWWSKLISTPKERINELKLSSGMRKTILQHLLDYYRLHLSYFRDVLSLKVLSEVFS